MSQVRAAYRWKTSDLDLKRTPSRAALGDEAVWSQYLEVVEGVGYAW
jgi:hypothetical protein